MSDGKNVCLVDDDDVFHFITKKIIKDTGLAKSIKAFYNGREALQFIKSALTVQEELPDIILLDLTMPVMDGWEFLDEYTELGPDLGKKITLYIVSSSIDPEDIKRASSISEVTDFIIKPVSKKDFVHIVERL